MLKLFHGENSYESWKALIKSTSGIQAEYIDGETLDNLDKLLLSHDTFSMFTSDNSNLIIVKRFFKNKKRKLHEELFSYLSSANIADLNLVFWEDEKVDKRSKLYKFIKKNGQESESGTVSVSFLTNWLSKLLKKNKVEFSRDDIDRIIELVGTDQYQLENEVEKLVLFMHNQNVTKIDRQALSVLTTNQKEVEIWAFLDAVTQRDKNKIFSMLDIIYTNQNDFPYISAMLVRQLKIMYLLVTPKITEQEITEVLGMHPYTLKNAKRHIHKFSTKFIVIFLEKLTNLDFQVKQGKIDPKLGLTLLLSIM